MTRPFVRIIDGDSVIEREMNDVEYEQYLTDQDMFEAERQASIEKEKAREALLARLGITAEEAQLLLGGQ